MMFTALYYVLDHLSISHDKLTDKVTFTRETPHKPVNVKPRLVHTIKGSNEFEMELVPSDRMATGVKKWPPSECLLGTDNREASRLNHSQRRPKNSWGL